jgi:ribosomal protein S18 acetylase RimI-like enzyme
MSLVVCAHPKGAPLPLVDRDLQVQELVVPTLAEGKFTFTLKQLTTQYFKQYKVPVLSELHPESEVLVAYEDDMVKGVLIVEPHWTGFADICDLAVQTSDRGRGVGTALVASCKEWALLRGLNGVRAETQNTNVRACNLYSRSGFALAGVDAMLYAGQPELAHETALFWYWRPDADA